jgi:serine-type D-Ala-D-Ala carboxypeptidase/endopeptidase (penicillin-binding protein 4)
MRLRVLLLLCVAAVLALSGALTLWRPVAHAPTLPVAAADQPNVTFAPDVLPPPRTPEPEPEPQELPAAASEEGGTAAPAALPDRLAAALRHPALSGAQVGITVVDDDSTVVFDHNGDVRRVPASTQKLVVAAAALATLGPEYRYTTTVHAAAPPDPEGVLHGDLVLVGSGDPALATPQFGSEVYPQRPRTPLESLADQIVAAGVTRITGGVLGDPSFLPHDPLPSGWLARYLEEVDGTYSSGLTVDAGRKMFVRNGRLQAEAAVDPAAEAAAALYTLLVQRGLQVDGGVASATGLTAAVPLAAVHSPALGDLLRHTVQRSDNHMADAIFRTVGAAAGDGTWVGSARATQASLAPLALDWRGIVLADGSGLSRDNRLTPRALVQLDRAMAGSAHGAAWESFMAVSGQSGTLRNRLRGTVAQAAMRGKTGLLRDVRALSGAVHGPRGRYWFTIMGDELDRPGRDALREVMDEVVLLLAEDLRGCTRIPLPEDAPVTYELACAA